MSEMLISVPGIPGSGSEATTIPIRGGRENISKLCRVALIALPILVSGAAAIASEDVKTYPGAMCQPQNNTDRVTRELDGRMRNNSGTAQTWICPVVRDVEAADGVEFAAITVIGTTATVRTCLFHSMRVDGSQATAPVAASNIAPSGNDVRLQYATGNPNILSTMKGYYHFECHISNGSGVVTYEVDENEGEG